MNDLTRDFVPPPPSSHLRARDYRNQNHCQEQHEKKQLQHQNVGRLIQSNSIQNQFTILSNQRDDFIRERDVAENELERVQKEHQRTKAEHDTLIESNRQAQEELGQKMEKLAMLKDEESRLSQLTENELNAIHNCTKHSKSLEKKKYDTTKRYTAEIDPLNYGLAALLERRIQKKTERCITVQSIETVILPKFDKALLGKNKPQLLNQRETLYESIELLKSASEQREKYVTLLGELKGVQQHQRGVEINVNSRAATGVHEFDTNKLSNHIDVFYGTSNHDYSQTEYD